MSGSRRIKVTGPGAAYHIVTRVHKREFLLNDHMKRFIVETLKCLDTLFEVELGAWAVLDNHLHLLCRYADPRKVDPDSAIYRWNQYHTKAYQKNRSIEEHREYVPRVLTDVSFFMKKLKTLITREYNRIHNTHGTLWERRFRSSIVERGMATLMTAAYIELNSFRASIVARPENYKYSSLNWLKKGNPGDLLATDMLDESLHADVEAGISEKQKRNISKRRNKQARKEHLNVLYRKYLKYVYQRGTRAPKRRLIRGRTDSRKITESIQEQLNEKPGAAVSHGEEGQEPVLEQGAGFCRRIWSFSRGKFIGSRSLAGAIYGDHVDPGYVKKSRSVRHRKKWLHGMSGGVWGVYNGSRRRREEKEWEEQNRMMHGTEQGQGKNTGRDNDNNINTNTNAGAGRGSKGDKGAEEKGRWIEGSPRGSPPT